MVSIHAPAGGATTGGRRGKVYMSFYPRARGGRDHALCESGTRILCFYPRARGGRDVLLKRLIRQNISFYPRARGGRDV